MNELFFCESCRTQLAQASELHYVEDNSDRGFCSETCILNFYRPYMGAFEQEEASFRKQLALEEKNLPPQLLESDQYLQSSLDKPSEIYFNESEIGQVFYTHITELLFQNESYYSALIVSYVDSAPSFVFYRTLTQSQSLLNLYRRGELMTDILLEDHVDIDSEDLESSEFKMTEDLMEEVESKKSMILADMLIKRSDDDIDFEQFIEYDEYLEKTLQSPDEIYEFRDDHGDILYTNIKSFRKLEQSFFYIVLTLPHKISSEKESTIQVPIIGFPSNDEKLYPQYAQGRLINEKLRN